MGHLKHRIGILAAVWIIQFQMEESWQRQLAGAMLGEKHNLQTS